MAYVFEPLFHCLTFSQTIRTLAGLPVRSPWTYPSAIVSWYYASYGAFRSMLYARDQFQTETHTATCNHSACSGIEREVPHPLNMLATHTVNEDYSSRLPNYPATTSFSLSRRLEDSRDQARGMMLEYLGGSAKWWVARVKADILESNRQSFQDFRKREAREMRDRQLPSTIGFLHCAFRYRGKANYRDATYLAYGSIDSRFDGSFLTALANSSRFMFIVGLAYVETRCGASSVKSFLEDVDTNLRGRENMEQNDAFWRGWY